MTANLQEVTGCQDADADGPSRWVMTARPDVI